MMSSVVIIALLTMQVVGIGSVEVKNTKMSYFEQHRDDFQAVHLSAYLQHLTSFFTTTSSPTQLYTFFLLGIYHSDFITTWFQCQLPINTKMHVFEPLHELYVFLDLFLKASHPAISNDEFITQTHVDIYLHHLGIANRTSLVLKDEFPLTKVPPKMTFEAFNQHQRTHSTSTSIHLPLPSIQLPISTLPNVIEQINRWPKVNLDQLHHFPNANSSYFKQFPAIPQVTYLSIHMPGMESTIIQGMGLEDLSNQEMFPMFHVKFSGSRSQGEARHHLQLLQHLHNCDYNTYFIGRQHLLPLYPHELESFFKNIVKSKWIDAYVLVVQTTFASRTLQDFIQAYAWADEATLQKQSRQGVLQSFANTVPTCPKVIRKKRVHASSSENPPVVSKGGGNRKKRNPSRITSKQSNK